MIQNPVAIVDKNVDEHCVRDVAEAFVDFLHTKDAKAAYTDTGFLRSTDVAKAQAGDPAERLPGDPGPLHGRGPRRLGRAEHEAVQRRRHRDPGGREQRPVAGRAERTTMSSAAQITTRSRTRRFSPRSAARLRRLSLRGAAIVYLGGMVFLPVTAIILKGFGDGLRLVHARACRAPGRWPRSASPSSPPPSRRSSTP